MPFYGPAITDFRIISTARMMEEILKIFTLKPLDAKMMIVSAILFVIFWRLLNRALFHPFFKLVEEREARTSGAMHQADDDLKNAVELETLYSEKINTARIEGMKLKLQLLDEAKGQASKIVEVAHQEAELIKARGKEALRSTTERLLESFPAEVDKVSADIVRQVTSDPVTIM